MNAFHDLIRHDLKASAREELDAVIARRPLASAAVAEARTAVGPLQVALQMALAGGGGDVHAAQAALDVALNRQKTAEAMAPAIEGAIRQANDEYAAQVGAAHQPVADDGFLKALRATRDGDAALDAFNKATADFHAAIEQINFAASNGAHTSRETVNGSSPSRTRAAGAFVLPTFKEMLVRVAEPVGRRPGVDANGNFLKS